MPVYKSSRKLQTEHVRSEAERRHGRSVMSDATFELPGAV